MKKKEKKLAQQKSGRNAAAALRQSWGFLKDVDVAQKKKKIGCGKKNLLQIDIPARKQTQS